MAAVEIVICMGSSCFARGNEENLRIIESFIAENHLENEVALSGSCCTGKCAEGPNLIVDGVAYHHMEKEALIDLLNAKFRK